MKPIILLIIVIMANPVFGEFLSTYYISSTAVGLIPQEIKMVF